MKVILTSDIASLGRARSIVEVKPGYANNYLIKNGLALPASEKNMEKLNEEVARLAAEQAAIRAAAEELATQLGDKTIKIAQSGGPDGKLYGSVTSSHVAEALAEQLEITVDKRKLLMDAIKSAGTYTVKAKLHPEVEAEFFVVVVNK